MGKGGGEKVPRQKYMATNMAAGFPRNDCTDWVLVPQPDTRG